MISIIFSRVTTCQKGHMFQCISFELSPYPVSRAYARATHSKMVRHEEICASVRRVSVLVFVVYIVSVVVGCGKAGQLSLLSCN